MINRTIRLSPNQNGPKVGQTQLEADMGIPLPEKSSILVLVASAFSSSSNFFTETRTELWFITNFLLV